jgi:hypothetical protein
VGSSNAPQCGLSPRVESEAVTTYCRPEKPDCMRWCQVMLATGMLSVLHVVMYVLIKDHGDEIFQETHELFQLLILLKHSQFGA